MAAAAPLGMPSGKIGHHPGWKPLQGSRQRSSTRGERAPLGLDSRRWSKCPRVVNRPKFLGTQRRDTFENTPKRRGRKHQYARASGRASVRQALGFSSHDRWLLICRTALTSRDASWTCANPTWNSSTDIFGPSATTCASATTCFICRSLFSCILRNALASSVSGCAA